MTPEVIAKGHTPARNSKLAATLRRKYANGELDSISKAAVAANAPSARTKMAETQRRQYATGERIVNEAMNSPEAHAKGAATMHRKYVAGELDMLKQQAAANTPASRAKRAATWRLKKLLATIGNDWSDKARAFNNAPASPDALTLKRADEPNTLNETMALAA